MEEKKEVEKGKKKEQAGGDKMGNGKGQIDRRGQKSIRKMN